MSQNGSAGEAKDDIDYSVPAILRHEDRYWPCPSLGDAVAAWHVLPVEMRESASIEAEDGAVYRGREIEKLQHSPDPPKKSKPEAPKPH
jgi:hypothetical protein